MLKVAFWGLAVVLALPASQAAPPLHSGYAILTEPLAATATDLAQTIYVEVRGRKVREGVLEMLRGTGYRLASEAAADPEIGRLYGQPYPESQRAVGPIELGAALERLAGPAWQLVVDPFNRLVSFEVHPAYRTDRVAGSPVAEAAAPAAPAAPPATGWPETPRPR